VVLVLALMGLSLFAGGEQEGAAIAAEGPVEIVWWHKEGAAAIAWGDKLAEEYMAANPNVTITIEPQTGSWGDFGSKLRLALRSGKGPDIFSTHDIDQQPFVAAGFTLPAPDYLAAKVDKESIDPTYRAMAHLDGDLSKPVHIMNWFTHWQQAWYNTDHLADAGLSTSRAPATWQDYRQTAKKLTVYDSSGNISRPGWTFRIQDPTWCFSSYLYSAGGTWLNPEQTASSVTTAKGREAWAKALQYIYDVTWKDRVGDFQAGDPQKLFYTGQVSMANEGIYYIASLANNAPEVNYLTGNMPQGDYSAAVLAVRPISVSKDADNPEAAWRWVDFILKDENLALIFDPASFSLLPPYEGAMKLVSERSAAWQIASQQKNIRARMQGLGASDAWTTAGRAIEGYLSKSMELDEALRSVEQGFAKILGDRPIRELQVGFEK
jgi:ABC-type glycerol-3-phosphate transport system substrate-binding protein